METGDWGGKKEVRHQKMERSVPGLGSPLARWCVAYGAYSKKTAAPPSNCEGAASAQLGSVQIVFRPRFAVDASLAFLAEGRAGRLVKCCTRGQNGNMNQVNMELHSADIEN